ncbi:MAG TPA: transglutaminase family protein [Solirubrobacterales bacterium]|nr:transglutaminase family protein [Solirubrobacterales bacterium]
MRYSIIYNAEYRYAFAVTDQQNALRIRPADNGAQTLEGFDLTIDPAARLYRHSDYFGTEVIQFAISESHDHLRISAEARVSTEEPPPPPDPGADALTGKAFRDRGAEYLGELEPAADREKVSALADEVRGDRPLQTLRSLCELIPDRFEYRPGATYVGSTVDDLLEGGAGVCQDFVHLGLTLLRGEGIPARYVSGYLFAPNGDSADSAEVNTHAWLEALIPAEDEEDEPVWVAADPTNRSFAGDDHVKIGHGRAYSDVPPIRGVYRGRAESSVEASVRMTRLDRSANGN